MQKYVPGSYKGGRGHIGSQWSRSGWWAKWTLGRIAQCLEMLEFILLIVLGWKSFLWSKVDRVIFELGKVSLAFSTTALRESDNRSCWLRRSLVPVWIIMWLGRPSWDSVRSSRALSVVGHQNLTALCRGKISLYQ